MEYLKEILQNRPSVPTLEEYIRKGEEELFSYYVDYILENEGIELEKLTGKKEKVGEIAGNEIFVYKVSDKYIKNDQAIVYIHIGGKRNNNYRLEFNFDLGKMITGDYKEEGVLRLEKVVLKPNIFVQDKKNKKWYLMDKLNYEFKKELEKIIPLIVREYLNPYFLVKNKIGV